MDNGMAHVGNATDKARHAAGEAMKDAGNEIEE